MHWHFLRTDARVTVCCADSGPFERIHIFLSTGRMGSSSLFGVEDGAELVGRVALGAAVPATSLRLQSSSLSLLQLILMFLPSIRLGLGSAAAAAGCGFLLLLHR